MAGADHGPVLLVEDTATLSTLYETLLGKAGYEVHAVADLAGARAELARRAYPIILLDLMLPDGSGLEILAELDTGAADAPKVLVITSHGSINRAVEAMRAGAFDFLVKPFDDRRLLNAVKSAARSIDRGGAHREERPPETGSDRLEGIIGSSPAMREVFAMIGNVARSTATVFLTGESGTGKELAAQAIHSRSSRRAGPFVPINCGAIPAELLESEVFGHLRGSFTGAIADKIGAAAAADGGTLFLDEICEMPLALQTKLLRFLQTSAIQPVGATRAQEVDVRIVCATNRDPLAEVRDGRFREDLYYRLHVVPIEMPALRARGGDVIEIAERLLASFAREEGRAFTGFEPEAAALIARYRWPGNVRELQNVLRNVVVLHDAPLVAAGMLPPEIRYADAGDTSPPASPDAARGGRDAPAAGASALPELGRLVGRSLAEVEAAFIAETVASCGGSITQAAALLGVSPSTLYRRRAGRV